MNKLSETVIESIFHIWYMIHLLNKWIYSVKQMEQYLHAMRLWVSCLDNAYKPHGPHAGTQWRLSFFKTLGTEAARLLYAYIKIRMFSYNSGCNGLLPFKCRKRHRKETYRGPCGTAVDPGNPGTMFLTDQGGTCVGEWVPGWVSANLA